MEAVNGQAPTLVVDKEELGDRLTVSEAAREMGVSTPRVSELLRSGRIPEAIKVREGNRDRTYIPNRRCIIPPEDPKLIHEDAAITRWYMTPQEAMEALYRAGRIGREEYERRVGMKYLMETLGLDNGLRDKIMEFRGIKGMFVILFD